MSVAAATRHSIRPAFSIRRHASSQASPPKFSLPPQKLRALISLHHESAHFITPQNLSAAIDRAFIGDGSELGGGMDSTPEMNFEQLREMLRWRRSAARTGDWKTNETHQMKPTETGDRRVDRSWSDGMKSHREKKVMATLYGTDGDGRPGLENVMEERARLMREKEDDRA